MAARLKRPLIVDSFCLTRERELRRHGIVFKDDYVSRFKYREKAVQRFADETEALLECAVLSRLCNRGRIDPGEVLLERDDPFRGDGHRVRYHFPERR